MRIGQPPIKKQYYVKPISKFIPFQMELQIPLDNHTQEKKKRNLWKNKERTGKNTA